MTETSPFVTTSGTYLSTLLGLWLPRHGWKVLLPLLLVALAGVIIPDARLILVALMLLFIVIPMGMSFLYPYYMLTPEARRAIVRKQVIVEPGESLTLHYLPEEKTEETIIEGSEDTPAFPIPEDETIPWTMIRRVKYTTTACVYILDTRRLQFIIVPYTAIPKGAVMA